ncbi:phenylalanine--tRNA ligase subunit alpha [Buchananella felis]|uniref:phenylalanine--tRNA ligase subunit alpha n=1 Tax=Buchananella felis TaxID=3231492 RepID=UPI0035291B14
MTQEVLSPLDEAGVAAAVEAALAQVGAAATLAELKTARLAALGDNAPLTLANREIRNLEPAQRGAAGKLLGMARSRVTKAVEERTAELEVTEKEAAIAAERLDVTVPTRRTAAGARHPLSVLIDEISDLFVSMGWRIAEGPEIEHEWFNFDALNFGPDHPARQMQDTFYLDPAGAQASAQDSAPGQGDAAGQGSDAPGEVDSAPGEVDSAPGDARTGAASGAEGLVLRTHTSPVQARVLLDAQPPLFIACPGKVFRTDALDATHTPVFHQVEGLAVAEGLTMAHLKGTLEHFARSMFGPDSKIRLRPSFFPFTEPSAEMDFWFPQKKGGPGWIEWGGCGMVNPNVLASCGIDPNKYTGFAFGMGLERTLMLRHGIADMHDIVEGDQRFSQQFGPTGRGK